MAFEIQNTHSSQNLNNRTYLPDGLPGYWNVCYTSRRCTLTSGGMYTTVCCIDKGCLPDGLPEFRTLATRRDAALLSPMVCTPLPVVSTRKLHLCEGVRKRVFSVDGLTELDLGWWCLLVLAYQLLTWYSSHVPDIGTFYRCKVSVSIIMARSSAVLAKISISRLSLFNRICPKNLVF